MHQDKRLYLAVPYAEKDKAKKFGARWDPKEKKWHAPHNEEELVKRWPLNTDPISEIIGEDRTFGGNDLFVDLIPTSCWFTNARSCIHPGDWDRVRKFVYTRAGNQCECCQKPGRLEGHERWSYDEIGKIQKLHRLIALCPECHETTHIGLADIKGRKGIAKKHLMAVRNFTEAQADEHIKEAFQIWRDRNTIDWQLDLSILENTGIKLVKPVKQQERRKIASKELQNLLKQD